MSKLSSPAVVAALLAEHGIKLKQKWGQNFLVDENILRKIVQIAEVSSHDHVLEIGPGIGTLTQKLAEKAGRVTAFEVDSRLLPVLEKTLAPHKNVEIVLQDALAADYGSFCASGSPVKLVANLPYNIATPLLYLWLKKYRSCFSRLVCMVQKEVAERLVALPGSKAYGVLSVVCRYASQAEIAFTVPQTVFFPRPEVASAVVKMVPCGETALAANEELLFYKVVEAVFAKRRKTALNALHAALGLDKDKLSFLGRTASLDRSRRGETFTVEEFVRLTRLLVPHLTGSC
ncbi:MAG: 16S rRNA (adenine(1518)-N(6)/adenine(1519)-N(6))-dimethyltransferase RsmA [Firmicutes bacterium]|nr:16S rRNA (adenine(1518)-N(6)/adenine(1519)-N(6))-dimethyltransferase RsmA [Bacillota bacterium]